LSEAFPKEAELDKTKRKFKFTRDALDALPVPAEGRVDYSDTENVGLQLRVSSSGRKMFRVNLYKDGKNNYRNIGPYPELTLTAAKTKHKEIVAEIHLGTFVANPNKEATQPTVAEVFQAYLTHHQFNPEAPKADARKVQRQFDRFVFSRKAFCRLDASQLEVEHYVPVIRAAMERGNTTGNNLLRNAKAAINWGMKAPTNPMASAEFSHWKLRFNPFAQMQLQPSSNPQDERYLSEDQMNALSALADSSTASVDTPALAPTPKQVQSELRSTIERAVRRIAHERGFEPQQLNRALKQRFGKSRADMSVEQLKA
jgi:hypothetical protein